VPTHAENGSHNALEVCDFVLSSNAAAILSWPPLACLRRATKAVSRSFEKTLEHERNVTASINKLVSQARKEEDFATDIFLQWFVTEQIEEEASVTDVLNQLKLIKNDGQGLLMLDKELGARKDVLAGSGPAT